MIIENKKKQSAIEELGEIQTKDINMHMILIGNPGTGKTTIAKLLDIIYYEIGLLSSPNVIETK